MSDNEFDLLDELYFIVSYASLQKALNMSDKILKSSLVELWKKGLINCYISPTEELKFDIDLFEKGYINYYYLATKAGLMAHNSNF